MALSFELLATSGEARRGRLTTRHSTIETPVFMPVGTLATVKGLDGRDLEALGANIILNNAYHLALRPGSEEIAKLGGLHRFQAFDGSILTDSGGFQIFSLQNLRKIDDSGVSFRSHIDGTLIELSPERLVRIQEDLGPDIAMVLDECPPAEADRDHVARAVERTTLWAKRCLDARKRDDMAWFGIAQGALFDDLRCEHAEAIGQMPFDGVAIGGVSVGESSEDIDRVVRLVAPKLPPSKPRYLMGVGTPADLIRGVAAGIDMFDCVLPTRNARNGQLFTSTGKVNIKHSENRGNEQPVDSDCACPTCQRYSRGYLRHLYAASELSYHRYATLHNVHFFLHLMQTMREQLESGRFDAAGLLSNYGGFP